VLLVNLLQSDKAWQEARMHIANREKLLPHKFRSFTLSVCVHALLVQHLYSVFF